MNLQDRQISGLQLSSAQSKRLQVLHRQALSYFIDNQLPHGLVLDRQRNHGRRRYTGLCSTSATGMGLIALVLASQPHHALITPSEARERIRRALRTALNLPQHRGLFAHFLDAGDLHTIGSDAVSTIDASWLIAGALWAAQATGDAEIQSLARRLYARVDWSFWAPRAAATTGGLLSHGLNAQGQFLPGTWDRFNAEASFLYLLAIGARESVGLPAESWFLLDPMTANLAGMEVPSGDLGLFVFQYSQLLLRGYQLPAVQGWNLGAVCRLGSMGNYLAAHELRSRYRSFERFWGISAGDGPGAGQSDSSSSVRIDGGDYRAYAPSGTVDGTVHLTATLASLADVPDLVLSNIEASEHEPLCRTALGRYGFSNFNVDQSWVSRDVVGIDIGAAVLALENALHGDTVRAVFESVPAIHRAIRRLNACRSLQS